MIDSTSYVRPTIETLDASQVVALLGPASAGGSQKGTQVWGSGSGFPMG